ncbi:MAG: SDR family NAD(P)-dependent oxidoreductase [Polyangiaceae bacterium]
MDVILTGASRGIGRALAVELGRTSSPGDRLFLLARDRARLDALHAEIPTVGVPRAVDLSRVEEATREGEALAGVVEGALLVHNAGVWPSHCERVDGVEVGFATNCLAPLALQGPLLRAGKVARVLVVSAGLIALGRFDPARTPTGADFSSFRTYCTTKLASAIAMREAARRHPEVDFAVVHPGVVRTDLGARRGVLGALLSLVKRRWESPEVCAARLARLIARPRWRSASGEPPWIMEDREAPWPAAVDRDARAVLDHLGEIGLTR